MSNRDWLLIIVCIYTIGIYCQHVYRSQKERESKFLIAISKSAIPDWELRSFLIASEGVIISLRPRYCISCRS